MKKALSCALVVSATAAFAAQPAPAPPEVKVRTSGNPDRVVCVNIQQIGSRLNTRRVCRTQAEWDDLQVQERQVVDRVQSFKPCPPVC